MNSVVKRLRLIYIYYFVSEFVFTPAIRWYRMPNLNLAIKDGVRAWDSNPKPQMLGADDST